MFSLGVTLYYMLFGELPYPKGVKSIVIANRDCRFEFSRALRENMVLKDFIERTVCGAKGRIRVSQLLKHPYLNVNSNFYTKINNK